MKNWQRKYSHISFLRMVSLYYPFVLNITFVTEKIRRDTVVIEAMKTDQSLNFFCDLK